VANTAVSNTETMRQIGFYMYLPYPSVLEITAVAYFMKEVWLMNNVPIWEKYTLTIEEASKYFRIGENKLRKLAEENPTAGWVMMNGNRIQIKRRQFEKIVDGLDVI